MKFPERLRLAEPEAWFRVRTPPAKLDPVAVIPAISIVSPRAKPAIVPERPAVPPERNQLAPGSKTMDPKLVICVPRPVSAPADAPVPSSSVLTAVAAAVLPPFTKPLKTAPGSTTRRLATPAPKLTVVALPPMIPALTTVEAAIVPPRIPAYPLIEAPARLVTGPPAAR